MINGGFDFIFHHVHYNYIPVLKTEFEHKKVHFLLYVKINHHNGF